MTEQSVSELPAQWTENYEIASLNSKIQELEMRLFTLETRFPNSNIVSSSFWTRALAVFGHQIAITLAFYGILFAIGLAFAALGALIGVVNK